MIKLVVDKDVKKEMVEKAIEDYKKEKNITDIVILDKSVYEKERAKPFSDIGSKDDVVVVLTKEEYDLEEMQDRLNAIPFLKLHTPEINFESSPSNTEIFQGRTEKQKREQDKWRRRYFRK